MQIIRTIIWVLLLVALLLFSIANWDPTITVRIWDGIVVDTKLPAIVIVSFVIGFVPIWLYYRAAKWQWRRKVTSLENAVRTAAAEPGFQFVRDLFYRTDERPVMFGCRRAHRPTASQSRYSEFVTERKAYCPTRRRPTNTGK